MEFCFLYDFLCNPFIDPLERNNTSFGHCIINLRISSYYTWGSDPATPYACQLLVLPTWFLTALMVGLRYSELV